jgi:rhodanese-related sulfurtransferase
MSIKTITPRELYEKKQQGNDVALVDVRTPMEFQQVHVPFARNVPLGELDAAQLAAESNGSSEAIYVICHTGGRGQQAGEKLVAAGCENVVNVEGGTQAWDHAGLPVERGVKVMSLERQVRVVAGILVVVGAVLGFFVHPYWIGLSAFVGAGLVYAGITDTCGMGLMLAKMPWNQVSSSNDNKKNSASACKTGDGVACSR